MKKLILILMLPLFLIGCEISNEPYVKMDKLSEPETVKISQMGLYYVDVLATHKYVMNKEQTLYYVPEIVKSNGETFINEKYGYVILSIDNNKEVWTVIKTDQAAKIVR